MKIITVEKIKNKIDDEVNSPNKIGTINNSNLPRPLNFNLTESYLSRLKCVLRLSAMYILKYKCIQKLYLYIKKVH